MQIPRQTHVFTSIQFAGGAGSPISGAGSSPVKPANGNASGSSTRKDTFQKQALPKETSTQAAGDEALKEFEERKRYYTNVLLNAVPKFRQKCAELKLNLQEEAEKAASKRALKETKWPAFPDWDFNSDDKPETSSPS